MKLIPTSGLTGAIYLVRTILSVTIVSTPLICLFKDQKDEFV
jgi:hypothetical protein